MRNWKASPRGSVQNAALLVYLALRRYKDAADIILSAPPGRYPPAGVAAAVGLLRAAPSNAPPRNVSYMGGLSVVFHYVGLPERGFEQQERNADAGFNNFAALVNIWEADFAAARKTERFKQLVSKIGLVDYWPMRGWPDLCRPQGADDFVCD